MNFVMLGRISCTFLILAIDLAAIGTGPDVTSKEYVLSEYPKALKALEARFARCSGEGIFTTFRTLGDGKARTSNQTNIEFEFLDANGRLIGTMLDDVGGRRDPTAPNAKSVRRRDYQYVMAYNDKYSFTLSKQFPASNHQIKMLVAGPEKGRREVISGPGHPVRCAFMAGKEPVAVIMGVQKFQVDRVIELHPPAQPRRLRIEFSIPRTPPPALSEDSKARRPYHLASGWFVVSPDEQWVLLEFGRVINAPTGDQSTIVGHAEYTHGPTGEPVPVKWDLNEYLGGFSTDPMVTNPGAVPVIGETFEFEKLRFNSPPDRDFTLTAFGLPEFGQIASRPRPWNAIWICVAAAVAIGVAFALRRLATRSRLPKAGQPA